MIISPPFLPAAGLQSNDPSETDPTMAAVEQFELAHHGIYPIAFDRRWHCGMHLAPAEQTEPVRAIADGEVIAYRVSRSAISDGQTDPQTGQPALNSNTGFVLLKHRTDTGDGRTITFYSLYMHLLDMARQQQIAHQPVNPPPNSSPTALPMWLLDTAGGKDGTVQPGGGRKVYRKDMLGYWGACHGMSHLHFEIFMTEADFQSWFEQEGHRVQIGEKRPVQPASKDYWGHSYFVIPGGQAFVSVPPGHTGSPYFPPLAQGALAAGSTLYVEAYFHKGDRYTRSWIDRGDGIITQLTAAPVRDPYAAYEYNLYQRAMSLYPACPSDGYELMRFGRVLAEQATLPEAARATYVAVVFDANGTLGYLDVNQSAIVKLSDADFPFFTGWQKIGDENTPFDQDGLCGYEELTKLVGDVEAEASAAPQGAGVGNASQASASLPQPSDPEFRYEDELTAYVQANEQVRKKLKGFVCHAPSEWDASGDDQRYRKLNDADGFFGRRKDTDPDGYEKFISFRRKFQFLEQTSLGGGKKFWFFHPLAFIRQFRRCGWLSCSELSQLLPSHVLQKASPWLWQNVPLAGAASLLSDSSVARFRRQALNTAARKYGITPPVRMACFFGNATQETQWFQKFHEGTPYWYKPWDGRGFLQLTHAANYITYWSFRGLATDPTVKARLQQHSVLANANRPVVNGAKSMFDPTNSLSDTSTQIPSEYIDRRDSNQNPIEAADSAGAYWTWTQASRSADKYYVNPIGRLRQVTTDHGPKYYYENQSFGSVAGLINTGSPSSSYASIWGIEARFLAFTNAQVVLMDNVMFKQADGTSSVIPQGFTRREIQ